MRNCHTLLPLLALLLPLAAQAQALPVTDVSTNSPAAANDQGAAGIVPFTRGYNLSLATTSQHDSSNGWSSLLTPDLAYRFNPHFSADVSAPIFTYINVEQNGGTAKRPVDTLVTRHFLPGDTALNGHYETSFLVDYNLTATLGLPSGSQADGTGAGQVTYDVNNHFEHSLGIFTPDLELGIGDSSALFDSRIHRSFTSVGTLAHFQVGTGVDLPRNLTFDAEAYEDLPLSAQNIYSTTGRGKKKVTTATSKSVGEDNGFLSSLDIPLAAHVTLSGFYNRSLRNHIDTAGFTILFLLKAPPSNRDIR